MIAFSTTESEDISFPSSHGVVVLPEPTPSQQLVPGEIPVAVLIGTRIPVEVIERFIDCLRGDYPAMCQCAVVCQWWNACCTFHLYGSIQIAEWHILHALLRSLRQHTRVRDTLNTMTEELVIHEIHSADWMATGRERGSLSTTVLLKLARLTASVRHLHFDGLLPPAHPSFYVGLAQLNTVTKLTITGTELSSLKLARFVGAFPHLRHLSVYNPPHDSSGRPSWLQVSPPHELIMHHPLPSEPLTTIDLGGGWETLTLVTFLHWLADSPACTSIEEFRVPMFMVKRGTTSLLDVLAHRKSGLQDRFCPIMATYGFYPEDYPIRVQHPELQLAPRSHHSVVRHNNLCLQVLRDVLSGQWLPSS